MKYVKLIFFIIICISNISCSISRGPDVMYINGDVRINGILADKGPIDSREFSINTGENSSVIVRIGSKMIFALSEETSIHINKNYIKLIGGRIIIAPEDDVVVESREISVKTEKSLFEFISKSNVSVVNNYSGKVYVKGISSGKASAELILYENFSIESVNGSLSPSQALGTDVVRKSEALKDISISDNPDSSIIMDNISPECISLINSQYGMDIEQRYAFKVLSSARGPLSEIVTKRGKRIIGTASVSGLKMTIYTVDEEIIIPVSEVKSIKRYSGMK